MEALEIRSVRRQMGRQQLDRHAVPHDAVLGQVDATHAAGADVIEQLVLAEIKAFVSALQQLLALPLGQ